MSISIRGTLNSLLSGCSGSLCIAIDYPEASISKSSRARPAEEIDPSFSCDSHSRGVNLLVAVDVSSLGAAESTIEWASKRVLRPGDRVILLALPRLHRNKFPKLAGECCSSNHTGEFQAAETKIRDWCSTLARKHFDLSEFHLKVKVIPRSNEKGIIAAEALKLQASWIIIDRNLKKEAKRCVESCSSNVVLVSQGSFRILCLNLKNRPTSSSLPVLGLPGKKRIVAAAAGAPSADSRPVNDELSSSENDSAFTFTERGSSTSSSGVSEHQSVSNTKNSDTTSSISNKRNCLDERLISQTKSILLNAEVYIRNRKQERVSEVSEQLSGFHLDRQQHRRNNRSSSQRSFDDLLPIQESRSPQAEAHHLDRTSSVRKAVSLKRPQDGSPPLCSICQHSSPVFGRPPKRFSFGELEFATGGFCKANFLAEGGYGSVYRGVLGDGIPVAVKQHKLASSQGDLEFCSEVEVLSCAQHRNVVMLIGYCIEKNRRLLVYEFICNGSLDSHLYGGRQKALSWSSRHKIAVGAARGLRYLHEECRVGCIVHRDMRPNNILLTHDFEPMVGDFGLARWQPDGDLGVETRVIGTFGYLAPEYAQTGQITEKADVYSFGVVLLELVTGRKAIDITRPRGQQCLTEWARPLLEEQVHQELLDPALLTSTSELNQNEVYCMLHAAAQCTQRDPQLRPRMSQVLRMLDGDLNVSRHSSPMRCCSARLTYSPRSVSPTGRMMSLSDRFDLSTQTVNSYMNTHPIVVCNTKLSHQALKAAYQGKLGL